MPTHNARVKADWALGDEVSGALLNQLDQYVYESVNGDTGGLWMPAVPIEIGGAGLKLSATEHPVSGAGAALIQEAGGRIRTTEAGGFQLGGPSTDWPAFTDAAGAAAPRTRTVVQAITPYMIYGAWTIQVNGQLTGPGTYTAISAPILAPHHGATLASARVYFKVADAHGGGIAEHLPQFGIARLNVATNVAEALIGGGGMEDISAAVTGVDWYAGGAIQSYLFTCTQNHIINRTAYNYSMALVDEYGANSAAGNVYLGVVLSYSTIADMRFP